METADFEFVVGNTPDQLKGGTTRRLRSHLSKRGWQAYRLSATKTESTSTSTSISEAGSSTLARQERELRKRHRKKTHVTVTFECALDHDGQLPDLINKHNATSDSVDRRSTTLVPHIEYQLGGGRVDPFRAYPGQRRPYVPALVDHYIVHMAVDIPELNQPGARGLLRSTWFPLVLSEPACFEVIMLLSASNFVSLNNLAGLADQLLQLKANAIGHINKALTSDFSSPDRLSDGVIGAVAKMASFEAMHGDLESYAVHMEGLRRMIELRGGLLGLGLNGLLRRIVIWIDLNSSFLLNTGRVFPRHYFTVEGDAEPNPAAFTAS